MKVAWVTHRDPEKYVGGAEVNELEMIKARPTGVEVTMIRPGGVEPGLDEFDEVIVTGIYGYSPRELNIIGRSKPLFWVQDTQFSSHWFYELCDVVIFLNEMHRAYEVKMNPQVEYRQYFINHAYIPEFSEIRDDKKHVPHTALWAHRPMAHKGLDNAADWAKEREIPLTVLVHRPRYQVLSAMQNHHFFLMLPHSFDAGPRAVMEAQLSGCEIIVNDKVGIWEDVEAMRAHMATADKTFWQIVEATS